MNRRRFAHTFTLASVASALRLPLPGFLRSPLAPVAPVVDLSAFCHPSRKGFTAPWGMGGHWVASDGRFLVRRRAPGLAKDGTAPAAENLPWSGPWGRAFRILPFPKVERWEVCSGCGGTGKAPAEWASEDCFECEGGRVEIIKSAALPEWITGGAWGGWFLLWRLQALMALPGLTFRFSAHDLHFPATDCTSRPLFFAWAEGDGMLMPLAVRERSPGLPVLSVEWAAPEGRGL